MKSHQIEHPLMTRMTESKTYSNPVMDRIPEGMRRSDWQIKEAVDEGGVKHASWKLRVALSTVYRSMKRIQTSE